MTDAAESAVETAFQRLIEAVDAEIELVNEAGALAFQSRDYQVVAEAGARAEAMTALRSRLKLAQEEWIRILGRSARVARQRHELATAPPRRRGRPPAAMTLQEPLRLRSNGRKSINGQVTAERQFFEPILRTLAEHGGSAPVRAVIDTIQARIGSSLTEADLETLATTGRPRWQNRAMWARKQLVDLGLLAPKREQGIWEISEAGRRWLAEHSHDR